MSQNPSHFGALCACVFWKLLAGIENLQIREFLLTKKKKNYFSRTNKTDANFFGPPSRVVDSFYIIFLRVVIIQIVSLTKRFDKKNPEDVRHQSLDKSQITEL